MTKPHQRKDYSPVTVPFAAIPTGEPPEIAQWAQVAVWTERMLDTLNVGVRGGKWHALRRNPRRQPAKQRWPNAFFSAQGLYSLSEAHANLVQTTGTY
jgi:hypothetical protein